jgi:hypothetical protein
MEITPKFDGPVYGCTTCDTYPLNNSARGWNWGLVWYALVGYDTSTRTAYLATFCPDHAVFIDPPFPFPKGAVMDGYYRLTNQRAVEA